MGVNQVKVVATVKANETKEILLFMKMEISEYFYNHLRKILSQSLFADTSLLVYNVLVQLFIITVTQQ